MKPHIKISKQYGRFADKYIGKVAGETSHIDLTDKYIKKVHGKDADAIIQQRGSGTRNPIDGAPEYGRIGNWINKKLGQAVDVVSDRMVDAGAPGSLWDTIQMGFGWGEYSDENREMARREGQLTDMLGTSMTGAIAGQKKMEGFLDEQYGQKLEAFDLQEDKLNLQADAITTGGISARNQMTSTANAYQGKLAGSGAVSGMQEQMKTKAYELGGQRATGREGINISMKGIDLGRDQAYTQTEVDKYKVGQDTGAAIARMLADFMSATGGEVPEEFMSMYEDYMGT